MCILALRSGVDSSRKAHRTGALWAWRVFVHTLVGLGLVRVPPVQVFDHLGLLPGLVTAESAEQVTERGVEVGRGGGWGGWRVGVGGKVQTQSLTDGKHRGTGCECKP